MPPIKASETKIPMLIDKILPVLFFSKKVTRGKSRTESKIAKTKGISMFWATLIKKQIKKITKNWKPSLT